MSQQTVETPNNNRDHMDTSDYQSVEKHADLVLYGSPVSLRPNKNARRSTSFVKMITDDQNQDDNQLARFNRRGTGFLKTLSADDTNEDSNKMLGKALRPDVRRGSSFIRTCDDSVEDGSFRKLEMRRGSSFLRTDDAEEGFYTGRGRRGSSFIRMISEDTNSDDLLSTGRLSSSRRTSSITDSISTDDSWSRRSSRASDIMRRGSSLVKIISEENDEDQQPEDNQSTTEVPEKVRKSLDNTYRHSLESINENKPQTFSSGSMHPSIEYSSASIESPTSDLSSDFAQKSSTESNKDTVTDKTYVNSSQSYMSWIESVNSDYFGNVATHVTENDNRVGEWNSFWSNYNSSTRNDYYSSPYLCPSNSGEDLSFESNESVQKSKGSIGNVVLSADEANEALYCSQRLISILRAAIKRSSDNEICVPKINVNMQNNFPSKDDEKPINTDPNEKEKPVFKPTTNSCIDAILNHTGVADILKRVISKRRDILMPSDDSSGSDSPLPKKL